MAKIVETFALDRAQFQSSANKFVPKKMPTQLSASCVRCSLLSLSRPSVSEFEFVFNMEILKLIIEP